MIRFDYIPEIGTMVDGYTIAMVRQDGAVFAVKGELDDDAVQQMIDFASDAGSTKGLRMGKRIGTVMDVVMNPPEEKEVLDVGAIAEKMERIMEKQAPSIIRLGYLPEVGQVVEGYTVTEIRKNKIYGVKGEVDQGIMDSILEYERTPVDQRAAGFKRPGKRFAIYEVQ